MADQLALALFVIWMVGLVALDRYSKGQWPWRAK